MSERDGELLAFFGYNATGTAEADRWRAQAGALAKRQLHKQYAHQMRVAYHQYRLVYEGVSIVSLY